MNPTQQQTGLNKDLLKSQTDILKMQQQLPSEHQSHIDRYSQLSEATGYKQRPNEPWRALLDGMFKGMALGERSKMNQKTQEEYDRLAQCAAFITDTARSSQQALDELNRKEKIKETISGYVSPIYTAMMSGVGRNQIDDMGRTSFNALQDQQVIPEGAVYLTIDPQTKTMIYNKADKTKGYVDLMPYIGKQAMEMNKQRLEEMGMTARLKASDASQLNAEAHMRSSQIAQARLDLDRFHQPQQMAIDRDRVAAYQHDINNRWNPYSQFDISSGKVQGSEGAKKVLHVKEENIELEDIYEDIKSLEHLLKNGQVITGETFAAKGSRLWAEMRGSNALSDSETYDATAKSLIKFANNHATFGNANTKEFDFLRAPVPDSHKTKAANLALLDRFSRKLKTHMDRNERFISGYENFNRLTVPEQTSENNVVQTSRTNTQDEKQEEAKPTTITQASKGVVMMAPDGSKGVVPQDQVAEALRQHYRVVP